MVVQGCFGDMDRLVGERGETGTVDGVALRPGRFLPCSWIRPSGASRSSADGPLDMRMAGRTSEADRAQRRRPGQYPERKPNWRTSDLSTTAKNASARPGGSRHRRSPQGQAHYQRTLELAEHRSPCRSSAPTGRSGHEATRTFQSLRIYATNDELGELDRGLNARPSALLAPGGRISPSSLFIPWKIACGQKLPDGNAAAKPAARLAPFAGVTLRRPAHENTFDPTF